MRPEEAAFTGDTVRDVQACRKAAVPCIGLLSGGISRDELAAAGAAQVYASPGELLSAFDSSLLGSGQARGSQPSVGREVGRDGSRGIS